MPTIAPFHWQRVLFLAGPETRAEIVRQLSDVGAAWDLPPQPLGIEDLLVVFVRQDRIALAVRSDRESMSFACVLNDRGYRRDRARFDALPSHVIGNYELPVPILATQGARSASESRCLVMLGTAGGGT